MLADAGTTGGLIALTVFALYFIPSLVAMYRRARATGPVVVVNLFLGWTFVGWVIALAMAFGARKDDPW